ncbi:MAG: adenylate/guanylate cyclase domain-containing protein [Actinomycetota bacterium]|nr:adenylate/guanylate cyclase domain-containing protein [Actinomycetota bacterium]
MPKFASQEDEWRAYLAGTHPSIRFGQRTFRHVPSSPRCKLCSVPFAGPGRLLFGRLGFTPWDKNPNLCRRCVTWLDRQEVSGAEIEISFLFADVRRSSDLARRLGTMEFTRLMQRFYATATNVLIADEAIIEKFVGDEVVGFFMPLLTGPNHAAAAVRAAEHLLLETGHGEEGGPWLPLGAGVHTGVAFVGMVSRGTSSDFTAFGDPINVAAHVAAEAAPGEILITDAAAAAADLATDGLERRHLSLKGHEANAVVLPVPSESSRPASSP